MFSGVTGVKFPLVPFETAFWNPQDFNLIINAITFIEMISSVCSQMNYSSLNTSSTQTFHLLLALQGVCETYCHWRDAFTTSRFWPLCLKTWTVKANFLWSKYSSKRLAGFVASIFIGGGAPSYLSLKDFLEMGMQGQNSDEWCTGKLLLFLYIWVYVYICLTHTYICMYLQFEADKIDSFDQFKICCMGNR